MSDSAETSAAPIAPAETPTPVQSTAAAAPQAPATQAATAPRVEMTPEQLKARLDEERAKAAQRAKDELLKSLGVPDVNEAKAAIDAKKKLDDEKRSELERKDREIDALKPKAARLEEIESVLREQADAALSGLTDQQRAVVADIAGEDPAKVLKTIVKLRPTWAVPVIQTTEETPPAVKPSAPAQQRPLPPATTTAPPRAPSPGDIPPNAPVDHLKVWEDLQKTAPHRAAFYYLQNTAAIVAAQNARSA